MCTVHNAREYEKYARERHAVAPKFILCGIGVRLLKPLSDLFFGLGFARTDDPCVSIPHLYPKGNFLIGRVRLFKPTAPIVREALKPCALRRSESANCVV